jgi:hypothetical protein
MIAEPLELTTASGLDDAIIGVGYRCGQPPVVVYSVERVIEILMTRDGMSNDEAIEFFEYNIEDAWMGNTAPLFMHPASCEDLQAH